MDVCWYWFLYIVQDSFIRQSAGAPTGLLLDIWLMLLSQFYVDVSSFIYVLLLSPSSCFIQALRLEKLMKFTYAQKVCVTVVYKWYVLLKCNNYIFSFITLTVSWGFFWFHLKIMNPFWMPWFLKAEMYSKPIHKFWSVMEISVNTQFVVWHEHAFALCRDCVGTWNKRLIMKTQHSPNICLQQNFDKKDLLPV